jgi:hypothetical protein
LEPLILGTAVSALNLEGKMEWVGMPIFTADFTDKMGLIYQISGSPNWQMP